MQSPEPDAKSVDTAAFSVHPSIEGTVRSEPRPVELGSAYPSGAAIPGRPSARRGATGGAAA